VWGEADPEALDELAIVADGPADGGSLEPDDVLLDANDRISGWIKSTVGLAASGMPARTTAIAMVNRYPPFVINS
jgi:hypothetical protein